MLGKTIFLMLLISRKSQALNFTRHNLKATNQRLTGGTTTTTAANPWAALLVDSTLNIPLGMAVILSNEWLICSSSLVDGKSEGDLKVYEGVDDTNDYSTTGTAYPVKNIIVHDNINEIVNALALLRVCPKISVGTAVTLPSAPVIYDPETDMGNLFSYATDLEYLTKKIGDVCECEAQPLFDNSLMFCLGEDPTKTVGINDMAGAVIVDNELAGIIVEALDNNAEIVINISKYRAWIQTNTGL